MNCSPGVAGSYCFQRTSAKTRVRPEATSVITREAWSAACLLSAPLERRPRTGRIRAAPISGRNVIQVSSEEVVGWSMGLSDDVLDDHERDGAPEGAVEVGLDVAGLHAPHRAPAVPDE